MKATKQARIVDGVLHAIWSGSNGTDLNARLGDGFEYRNFTAIDDVTDRDGLRQRVAAARSAHPDWRLEVRDVLESGDLVVVWWSFGANGQGRALLPVDTSAPDELDGACMFRLEGDRIVEMWELGGQL